MPHTRPMPEHLRSQTRSVEWLLAALMLGWSIGLLLPGDTMELPTYRYLAALAPEGVWASFSFSIGALRLFALYVNGSYFRTPAIRAAGAVAGIMFWLVIGFLFWISRRDGPTPAALMFFPVFVIFEGYSAYRGARDSYYTGALRRWRRNT